MFLQSPCEYITQDDGLSKDFVMRTKSGKDRVMMLWERPISMSSCFGSLYTGMLNELTFMFLVIVERTAKALMDGQGPGKSVLNIGFGIGLVRGVGQG